MTIWATAYDLPHLASPGKKIAWLPLLDYRWGKHADPFREEGSITIPSAYSRLNELHYVDPDDHSNDVGSVVHFFQRGVLGSDSKPVPVGSMVLERRPDGLGSEATSTVQLSGRGLTSYFLDRIKLKAFDYPTNPTKQPDWNFGEPDDGGLVRDHSFEIDTLPNGGFEEGNTNHWSTPEGGGVQAIEDAVQAETGDFYGLFNPNGVGSKLRRSITSVRTGTTYTVTTRIDDLNGSGERVRLGVNGASEATHTNAYEEDGIWYAEIGNATEGNGSTDGTYQLTTLTFEAAESPVEVFIEYLGSNDHNLAVDSMALSGAEFGVGDWKLASNSSISNLNIGEISTEQAHSGTRSLKLQGSQTAYIDAFGRISYVAINARQLGIQLTIGKIYTSSVWVYHEEATAQDFTMWAERAAPQGPLARSTQGGFLPAPGSYHMAANTTSVPPSTWTKLEWTSIADTTEVNIGVAWNGGQTDVGFQSSPVFWVDDYSMFEGLPAITYGELWQDYLLDDRLDWLSPTFTTTQDSDGNNWDENRGFSLKEGDSYGQIAESFQQLWRYVTRIRYDREDNTYYLDAFNPGYEAFDHSTTDTGTLLTGMNILSGESISRSPEATNFHIKGEGGVWEEGEDTPLLDAWGDADFFLDTDAKTSLNMIDILNTHKVRNRDQMVTFEASMNGQSQFEPLRDFDVFHKVQVNLGSKNPVPTGDRIVTSIVVNGKPGQAPNYQVYVNSDAFASTGAAALAEAVRRLLRRSPKRRKDELGRLGVGEGGGMAHVLIVSDSEIEQVQEKADFVVPASNSSSILQGIFDTISDIGNMPWSIWMAGEFDLDSDVTAPEKAWVRGLGYEESEIPT